MPDNGMRRELVRGEVREMAPAGGEHGSTSMDVGIRLGIFVIENRLGRVFAAETGFIIERDPDTVLAPDCAFVRADRVPRPMPRGYLPLAPDLAVETLSPDDRPGEVRDKIDRWLAAGVRQVWVIDPRRRTVSVHRPESPPRVLEEGGSLDGGDILPGFRAKVADLFL